MHRWMLILLTGALAGCASVKEDHYFVARDRSGKPQNYYRVSVRGSSQFSQARYVAGRYDERAVDLFFNQLRPDAQHTLFTANTEEPGSGQNFEPLSPDAGHGAFLLILSSNAKAVVDTIGEFAESQVTADAIVHLLDADRIRALEDRSADLDVATLRRAAVATELESFTGGLTALLPPGDPGRRASRAG